MTKLAFFRQIFNFLKEQGLTHEGICGVLGNLYYESGLNPRNLQNSGNSKLGMTDDEYTESVDDGTYSNFIIDSIGYGIAQWTFWTRKNDLLQFAQDRKTSVGDIYTQLLFLISELKLYQSVWITLTISHDVEECTKSFMLNYERPASNSSLSERVILAKFFYDYLGDGTMQQWERNAEKVVNLLLGELGYCEKKSDYMLYDKTANAGSANYTKYGKEMHAIYPAVMDYPASWCDGFIDWGFYNAYGVCNAKAMLGGDFDDYTVRSAQLYKNKGAYYKSNPRYGDQIFFTNGKRIYHTGLVYDIDPTYVYTVEGNTSDGNNVVANGGKVCIKRYKKTDTKIDGYGRPKYEIDSNPVIKEGWYKSSDLQHWWYQNADGTYPAMEWKLLDHHWYLFSKSGYMLTGWVQWDGKQTGIGDWYYLDESKNSPLEGVCWHEKSGGKGILEPWYIE